MLAYVLRRLLYAVPILLGVTLIVFLVFHVVAGDPAVAKSGRHADAAEIAANRAEMGTDRPLFRQYLSFLGETLTFDFGRSWQTNRPVRSMIADGVGPSLSLAVPAFVLETILAIALALFCAFYRGSPADVSLRVLAVAAISLPSLAYILFGQYWMGFRWKLFPIFGYAPLPAGFVFLAMPIVIWILLTVGSEMRYYRTVMLEEMSQDYVRTAAAKGLRPRRILLRHVLKNSMIPILTRVVITIPFLMLGSLLIEMFFGIPGLGAITADAIAQNDFPVIKALTVMGSVLYILFSVLTDVLYAVFDPRVRLR
jgi:peptide/nickel transport system permease protein